MNKLGRRLRRIRDEAGLSVRQLAEKAGVSPGYISRIEARNEIPSPEMLCKLAGILDAAPEELLVMAKEGQLQKVASDIAARHRSALTLFRKGKK
jgi:transcriptional regulator with XRE-family HTH domain